jgi:F420-0:gamma-glutamyl ligase-like protein
MRLVLRRDQRSGILGKMVFTLDVRAETTEEERANIRKYKLGDTQLYSSHEMVERGSGLLGVASRLAWKAVTLTITVNDLASGKRVEAKDVVELLAIEEHIREAAATFKQILDAAASFGGEEVVEI